MTQKSYWWNTGVAGDGSATYTEADLSVVAKVLAACLDDEGVAPAYLNQLAGSVPGANTARIATGGALVDGKPYSNDANVDVNIPSAVGGGNTRIDRIVLRASWGATRTVRLTRIAGTDAASPTAPAITQTPGTTYDLMLYQALVNTSGTVTLTDERVFARVGASDGLADAIVTTAKLADNAVTAAKIAAAVAGNGLAGGGGAALSVNVDGVGIEIAADTLQLKDGGVTAAKIANRTRKFFVQGLMGSGWFAQGFTLGPSTTDSIYGAFLVPQDFVSTLVVTPVIVGPTGASANNCVFRNDARAFTDGEAYNVDEYDTGNVTVACPANNTTKHLSTLAQTLTNAAVGEQVQLQLDRVGGNASDTFAGNVYGVGWIVSYTADS
ncbi:MAG: hypothetical protein IT318_24760 [Anaerolineales bacterium]|nr:hypothetical protein [Anaerolineales bacterium]